MIFTNYLEIAGAGLSILYSLLLMREKTVGWWFGIASSLIGIWLFYQTKIYAQSIVSLYYALVGVYGLWYWKNAERKNEHIHNWQITTHLKFITLFSLLSLLCAFLFDKYTDSSSPYLDSFITVFGLLASVKEARKILTSWVYWFALNAFSVLLYYQQELFYYAALMVVYTLICVGGFISWYQIFKQNQAEKNNA